MDKKSIIRNIKKHKLSHFDIPEEYRNDIDIVVAERQFGTRRIDKIGYDVILDSFFVVEEIIDDDYINSFFDLEKDEVPHSIKKEYYFKDFSSYYFFLRGSSIYERASYYKLDLSKIENSNIDNDVKEEILRKINTSLTPFICETIDDTVFEISKGDLERFKENEKYKRSYINFFKKTKSIKSYEQLVNLSNEISREGIIFDEELVFWNYILKDNNIWDRFGIVMRYVSTMRDPSYRMINGLCLLYGGNKVLEAFKYNKNDGGSRTRHYRRKKILTNFVHYLEKKKPDVQKKWYFDSLTNLYCEETFIDSGVFEEARYIHSFATIEDFVKYKGDLKDCDLSTAYNLNNKVLSKYRINKNTIIPINCHKKVHSVTNSWYEQKFDYIGEKSYFCVRLNWLDENDKKIIEDLYQFEYFCDYVYFLKNNLSGADLLQCDGLSNIEDFSDLILDQAIIKSDVAKKANLPIKRINIDKHIIKEFKYSENNENLFPMISDRFINNNQSFSEYMAELRDYPNNNEKAISYITDIHLLHRILNEKCVSQNDVDALLNSIAKKIVFESKGNTIIIGGDVSSDYSYFQQFVKALRKSIDEEIIIFVLGNHELWPFEGYELDLIVKKYKNFLKKQGMFLLHNNILYENDSGIVEISERKLDEFTKEELRKNLLTAKTVFFGGLGFSGYNSDFNAKNGIYRNTINRRIEIVETKKFEKLYKKLEKYIPDKNVVIVTHTPKSDWSKNSQPYTGFVYVNGHNHRNYFYDDGIKKVYADNQVGYHSKTFGMKYFYINDSYDVFSDLKDGIYQIDKANYNDFYRGKNISMTLNRDVNEIIMIKKNSYYCFFHKGKNGKLSLFNGATYKKLNNQDINYYYDNLDNVISTIKEPLDKYTSIQKSVSDAIIKIGGYGNIHGCIVDIDYYNHIYVNPYDLSITGYSASDIINKIVYNDIPTLLELNRPDLYKNYNKLVASQNNSNFPIVKSKSRQKAKPTIYLDTTIYYASRELNKMQKIYSGILTTWINVSEKALNSKSFSKELIE